jgi:hypothetical protein
MQCRTHGGSGEKHRKAGEQSHMNDDTRERLIRVSSDVVIFCCAAYAATFL